MKKILGIGALLLGFSFMGLVSQDSQDIPAITIELIDKESDFEKEKELFIKSYTFLYQGIADVLDMQDLEKSLEERFEREKKLFCEDESLFSVRVISEEEIVGFLVLDKVADEKLYMRRCAFDFSKDLSSVIPKVIEFVFAQDPEAKSIGCVVHKKSAKEQKMLKQFGLSECPLILPDYDQETYTSFEYKK